MNDPQPTTRILIHPRKDFQPARLSIAKQPLKSGDTSRLASLSLINRRQILRDGVR